MLVAQAEGSDGAADCIWKHFADMLVERLERLLVGSLQRTHDNREAGNERIQDSREAR